MYELQVFVTMKCKMYNFRMCRVLPSETRDVRICVFTASGKVESHSLVFMTVSFFRLCMITSHINNTSQHCVLQTTIGPLFNKLNQCCIYLDSYVGVFNLCNLLYYNIIIYYYRQLQAIGKVHDYYILHINIIVYIGTYTFYYSVYLIKFSNTRPRELSKDQKI